VEKHLDNRYKRKICAFTFALEENLFHLRYEMLKGFYLPRPYTYFTLHDPKTRAIAAPDIRKFFQSISWDILLIIIGKTVQCPRTLNLVRTIVTTHQSATVPKQINDTQMSLFDQVTSTNPSISVETRTGLPIGNLTSQLFANIYLNQLDHFVRDRLRVRHYARYMDDFLIIHPDKEYLKDLQKQIAVFLQSELDLSLHPKKLTIKNVDCGVLFVGYRIFYDHVLVRGESHSTG